MPARSAFPLFLLMLVWTLPARVYCQTLEVSLVSTEYVVIAWERILQWYGVEDFYVYISSEDANDCHKAAPCSTSTCSFNTSKCGLYQPCTATNIIVTGGKHTPPPLELVTGPEKVDNLTLRLEKGELYISWVNPSNDSSTCYEETAVTVDFCGEDSTDYFGHDIETTSKALCGRGNGVVEVWAEGGDGFSISSSLSFVYDGDDYSGMEGWAIALIVLGVCLVVVIIIGAVVYMKKKSKAQSKQRRQQQQLHQLQPPQYMYGKANPAASL